MKALLRIIGALGLLAITAFCVFGFMAAFEPSGSTRWPWQMAYGLVGVASLSGAVVLLRRTHNRGASACADVQRNHAETL